MPHYGARIPLDTVFLHSSAPRRRHGAFYIYLCFIHDLYDTDTDLPKNRASFHASLLVYCCVSPSRLHVPKSSFRLYLLAALLSCVYISGSYFLSSYIGYQVEKKNDIYWFSC